MKVLANDGIAQAGVEKLKAEGFEVITTKVAQEQLANYINSNNISVLLVRSATKVRKDLIDAVPDLKMIGRGGVGMDNIDVDYAKTKGIKVFNTPEASSRSVSELVFAHLIGGVRYLYDANRNMPLEGDSRFKDLKKNYSKGSELQGKTLGIIGFGRIGQEVAKMAIGIGMKVIATATSEKVVDLSLEFFDGQKVNFSVKTRPLEDLLKESDFITLHVPARENNIIGKKELQMMKEGAGIINTSRGGIIDETALLEALENGRISFAGLDTFTNEPTPSIKLLMDHRISLSPHIGAATIEAQEKIGIELADNIIKELK